MKKIVYFFKNLSKKQKIVLGLLAVVIVAGLLYAFVFSKSNEPQVQEPEQKYYSKLTGAEVEKDISERPILAVMVENSEEARPQLGLDSAGIVFEAVTEGGITRYMALYQEDMPEQVEPVRSLRTHFLNWLMGFDASVAHVGGSSEALGLVDARKAKSLTQFTYTEPYTRNSARPAPHNVIASTEALRNLQDKLGHKTSTFDEIPRKDSSPAAANTAEGETTDQQPAPEPTADNIVIDFSSPLFKVEFRYDAATDSYTRYLDGKPHIDRATDKPITVKNLVVIKAKALGAGLEVLGSGEALVFNDGKVQKARWQQTTFEDRVKILDDQNNEVPLLRGDSWFAAVGNDRPVKY